MTCMCFSAKGECEHPLTVTFHEDPRHHGVFTGELFGDFVEMKIVYTDYDVAVVYSCMMVTSSFIFLYFTNFTF